MTRPTLLVLTAETDPRRGSQKRTAGVGPNDETVIDYSIYDAIRAGFGKAVFVTGRRDEKEFREAFPAKRSPRSVSAGR